MCMTIFKIIGAIDEQLVIHFALILLQANASHDRRKENVVWIRMAPKKELALLVTHRSDKSIDAGNGGKKMNLNLRFVVNNAL